MPKHDYSAAEALNLLLVKLELQSQQLVARIRGAINAGKAELKKVTEPSESGRGPKRRRQYWQIVPYTDEEALQVALTVLEAHLVESRLFLNVAAGDFAKVGELPPKPVKSPESYGSAGWAPSSSRNDTLIEKGGAPKPELQNVDVSKHILIEAEPEQLKEKEQRDDLLLAPVSNDSIESLRSALGRLDDLTDFNGGPKHGNAR